MLTGTGKGSTFCVHTLTGTASLDADTGSMTFAVLIVLAVLRFTVHPALGIRHSCYIHKSVFFSWLKAAAAGSFRCVCAVTLYLDFVKVASFVYVVMTCYHGAI